MLVKFGFSALSVPRFFRRLVLNFIIVLKTSNSARLSAPEIQQTQCQMMVIGKTTFSDSFHWKKWTDLQHLERLQHQKCCTIWPSGSTSRSTEASMHALFAQLSSPEIYRNVTGTCSHDHCSLRFGRGTSNADTSFQHSKLKQWLKEVRIFRVSADNVSK